MALHCLEYWDDMARWDWRLFLVFRPPVVECFIWTGIKPCFGGGASPKALETSAPKMRRFSAAAAA